MLWESLSIEGFYTELGIILQLCSRTIFSVHPSRSHSPGRLSVDGAGGLYCCLLVPVPSRDQNLCTKLRVIVSDMEHYVWLEDRAAALVES